MWLELEEYQIFLTKESICKQMGQKISPRLCLPEQSSLKPQKMGVARGEKKKKNHCFKHIRKPVPGILRNRDGIAFSCCTYELQAQESLSKQKALFKAQILEK